MLFDVGKGSQNQDKIEEEGEEEEEDGISDVAARGESSHQHPKLLYMGQSCHLATNELQHFLPAICDGKFEMRDSRC